MRRTLITVQTIIAVAMAAAVAAAENDAKYFEIAAKPMAEALMDFGSQAGAVIVAPTQLTSGKIAHTVRGAMPATRALQRLLEGSGLEFSIGNDGAIVIVKAGIAEILDPETLLARVDSKNENRQVEQNRPNGSGEKKTGDIDEIVVTAQKREETLQSVPISMSVVGGEQLDKFVGQGVTDVLSRIPGVTVATSQGDYNQISIRGVSTAIPRSGGAPTIAYYLDMVPFGSVRHSFAPVPVTFDLDRIEVLRGPQGTLYGMSALNGVVRVLTKNPDLNQFEIKARTAFSATKNGGDNYQGDFAINLPLIDGKLAARAVLGYQDWSGWIDRPNLRETDSNDSKLRNLRLKVRAQPTERLTIDASAWIAHNDYGGPPTAVDGARTLATISEPSEADFDAYGLQLAYDFSKVSLSSMTSYLKYGGGNFVNFNPAVPTGWFSVQVEPEIFSEEINLTSNLGGPWRWTLGGMYRDIEDHFLAHVPGLFDRLTDDLSESVAVFGELTRSFLDGRLEVTAGLRHFEDKVEYIEYTTFSGAPPLAPVSTRFEADTPRLVLTWHPREQTTIYASYAEGFRSGLQQLGGRANPVPAAAPDTLANYELGVKSSFLQGRLDVESAVYYSDWQDVQRLLTVFVTNPATGATIGTGAIVNGESGSGLGAELSLTARVHERFEIGGNIGWNDMTLDGDILALGTLLFAKGSRLDYSPEYTGSAWADYSFPLREYKGRFSTSANYVSGRQVTSVAGTTATTTIGDDTLIARLSFAVESPDNRWSATLFAENINNESRPQMKGLTPTAESAYPRPRTIGVQLDYRY